jgi:general secretion pathway protein D
MNLSFRFAHSMLGSTLVAAAIAAGIASAQPLKEPSKNGREVTLNLKDADINTLIATVSEVTGKNFIIDPRVKGKVTVISSSPMNAAGVYETFLAVLQVNGFAAIPAGEATKIVLDANARTEGGSYLGSGSGLAEDEIVTHVYEVRNASAAQLVTMLRPLVAQSGQIASYNGSNSLIISDRASNVRRLERLIQQIDVAGDRDVELIPLQNASASDVVRSLTTLTQAAKQADPTAQQTAVIADDRSNSVLIAGPKGDRERLIEVIKDLDAPTKDKSGDTQVIYLRFASAENLAPILEGYAQQASKPAKSTGSMFGNSSGSGFGSSSFGSNSSTSTSTPAPTTSSSSSSSSLGGGGNGDLRVIPDKDTNALVITAPPKIMQKVKHVIEQLDIRRSQVLVEGIVAEVSANKASSLGVDYLAYDPHSVAATGILNSSTLSALQNVGSLASSSTTLGTSLSSSSTTGLIASAASSVIGSGATAVVGSFSNGHLFGALLKALQSDGDTNILSTPSLVTLDNEEAKFEVGQEVPFQTGSFANTGTASNGAVNPFQTIDRKDVGLKLGITPTIGGEGDNIRLKIEFENSSLASGQAGAANLVTNKRTLSNTVSIDGGQILVIGGLIDDQLTDSQTRIPVLSDIPILGALFRSRDITKTKTNLMIFIHPVILRTREEGDFYTRRKYDGTREAEIRAANGAIPLLGGSRPTLYRYEDYVRESNKPASATDVSAPKDGPPGAAPSSGSSSSIDPAVSPLLPPAQSVAVPAPVPVPVPEVAPESNISAPGSATSSP